MSINTAMAQVAAARRRIRAVVQGAAVGAIVLPHSQVVAGAAQARIRTGARTGGVDCAVKQTPPSAGRVAAGHVAAVGVILAGLGCLTWLYSARARRGQLVSGWGRRARHRGAAVALVCKARHVEQSGAIRQRVARSGGAGVRCASRSGVITTDQGYGGKARR